MSVLQFRSTVKKVARFGWTGIYVGDYHVSPTWAYTIGFHSSLRAPEIVLFDVPKGSANSLFHEVFNDLKAGKITIRDGDSWRPGETEHPVVWRRIHPTRLYDNDPEEPWLGLAEDFARLRHPDLGPIEAFQLVLSDQNGCLPWTPGYDERLRPRQRALWEPLELAGAGAL